LPLIVVRRKRQFKLLQLAQKIIARSQGRLNAFFFNDKLVKSLPCLQLGFEKEFLYPPQDRRARIRLIF